MEPRRQSPYYFEQMSAPDAPGYLQPYLSAARKHGAGFGTLLWASPKTQEIRFKALLDPVDVTALTVLDVGCGRADLLEYMIRTGQCPSAYIGLEAVDALSRAAEKKQLPNCKIIRGDFVSYPGVLEVNADLLLVSGALNTMDKACFYACLTNMIRASRRGVVFNFLASPYLAGASHLTWHEIDDVLLFCRNFSTRVQCKTDYLPGDATVCVWKESL